METERLFQVMFAVVFGVTLSISAFYRRRARQAGVPIRRLDEGALALLLRLVLALPLFGSFLAYALNPAWMVWSAFQLPDRLRGFAGGLALLCIPLVWWVFSSIGKNISETVLTKENHQLVTGGPYRWVRHPLYTVALLQFLLLSIVAGNWFMIGLCMIGVLVFRVVVIPKEEQQLMQAFGKDYELYRRRTGALVPRIWV